MTSPARPTVITLCGSMRFAHLIGAVASYETNRGHIVLAPFVTIAPADQDSAHKRMLDTVHRHKIAMSDRVMVVTDTSGYMGPSTRAEIAYALTSGIPCTVCQPFIDPHTDRWLGAAYCSWDTYQRGQDREAGDLMTDLVTRLAER